MPSRRELLDAMVDDVTRTTLRSADLGPEDRVLARQRVQEAIEQTAVRAHHDVLAMTHGDSHGPEADRFAAHMDTRHREQGGPDQAVRETPAGKLAADLVASDDRSSRYHPLLTQRAEDYIAHEVTVAAEAATRKLPGGPSQAPAAAAGPAAAVGSAAAAGAAAGPAFAPVAVAKSGVAAFKPGQSHRSGPSIG
ncbi:hypothetical protein ACQPYH_40190 [Kribbella sp. CA-245084]|uniref:hypothetical protein n=1 Tax=Kribbella sp. CA-245084 TaxID=3239940 RepID=UPI003D948557